ncbi:MAG TPA: SHOCT domain-containing protein [Actinomycetota bacterium]|nr:SHOCT domain-containing protein [Actinomycetota bacterium]
MRPNRIGWGLVVFFLLGGVAFFLTIPEIWIGQIWIAVSLGLAAAYLFMNWRADKSDELRATGIPGKATILEMTQTGVYINEIPQVRLKLRIDSQELPSYEVDKKMLVPHIALGALSSGNPLSVFIDRQDKDNFAIDWFPSGGIKVNAEGSGQLSVNDQGAQQAVLQALKDHGIDPQSGAVDLRQMPGARAAVLKALESHGIDAAHATASADPATPVSESEEPMDRLEKLRSLKNANLITESEFQAQKKRILEEI